MTPHVVYASVLVLLAGVLVAGFLRGRKRPTEEPDGADGGDWEGRLEELEDKYARLDRRFIRLQGEFSALTRLDQDQEPEP